MSIETHSPPPPAERPGRTGVAPCGAAATALALPAAVWALACTTVACTTAREEPVAPDVSVCAGCHGDSSGPAPVDALHRAHLEASALHAAVPCESCHVVPASMIAAGHADTDVPADVVLAGRGAGGAYDPTSRTCSGVACHGAWLEEPPAKLPVWDPAAAVSGDCSVCHGKPPGGSHPQSAECGSCHGTLDASRHGDGSVHIEYAACDACHGEAGSPAPPDAFHDAHLLGTGLARPVSCAECHVVPATPDAPGHVDPPPAEVVLGGVAGTGASWAGGSCSSTWCHARPGAANASPSAGDEITGAPTCGSCHGAPPPAPHPPVAECALCHAPVAGEDGIAISARHVDGVVDESTPTSCSACHGSATSPAPDIGAHAAHVSAGVACKSCHVVPGSVYEAGHVDTAPPAEVTFGGVATAKGSVPSWSSGSKSCSSTWCHGKAGWAGFLQAPTWDATDGQAGACGACHALPPPAPHPRETSCRDCHAKTYGTEEHVNGKVDF